MVHAGAVSFPSLRALLAPAILAPALSLAGTAAADPVRLTLSSWLPSQHVVVAGMIVPWAAEVEAATGGSIVIDILSPPLGGPATHFDLAVDGISDITYGVHAYEPGRFVLTQVAEFPLTTSSAEAASVAYWRIFQRYLADSEEHAEVKPLSLYVQGGGQLWTAGRPVDSVEAMSGLKVRVAGGAITGLSENIGIAPILRPVSEAYEILSTGVADGIFLPPESVPGFGLDRVIRHGAMLPGGFYNVSLFLVMNPDRFDSLTPEQQEALMSVSGEHFARLAGRAWDAADAAAMEAMAAAGIEITMLDEAAAERIRELSAPVEAAWIAQAEARGVDGAAVLEALRAEVALVEAER